jgi:hypothetical protein
LKKLNYYIRFKNSTIKNQKLYSTSQHSVTNCQPGLNGQCSQLVAATDIAALDFAGGTLFPLNTAQHHGTTSPETLAPSSQRRSCMHSCIVSMARDVWTRSNTIVPKCLDLLSTHTPLSHTNSIISLCLCLCLSLSLSLSLSHTHTHTHTLSLSLVELTSNRGSVSKMAASAGVIGPPWNARVRWLPSLRPAWYVGILWQK